MDKILKAIEFAVNAHAGQCRKGTKIPYVMHPIGVGRILMKYKCPETCVIAGVLHDTIEDTSIALTDISKSFGNSVAKIVEGCSEPKKSDEWINRKNHTIEFLKTAPSDIAVVSCADKMHNLMSIISDYGKIGDKLWQRFNKGKKYQIWYYCSLSDIFRSRQINHLYERALFKGFKLLVDCLAKCLMKKGHATTELKKISGDEELDKFIDDSSIA